MEYTRVSIDVSTRNYFEYKEHIPTTPQLHYQIKRRNEKITSKTKKNALNEESMNV